MKPVKSSSQKEVIDICDNDRDDKKLTKPTPALGQTSSGTLGGPTDAVVRSSSILESKNEIWRFFRWCIVLSSARALPGMSSPSPSKQNQISPNYLLIPFDLSTESIILPLETFAIVFLLPETPKGCTEHWQHKVRKSEKSRKDQKRSGKSRKKLPRKSQTFFVCRFARICGLQSCWWGSHVFGNPFLPFRYVRKWLLGSFRSFHDESKSHSRIVRKMAKSRKNDAKLKRKPWCRLFPWKFSLPMFSPWSLDLIEHSCAIQASSACSRTSGNATLSIPGLSNHALGL